MGEIASEEGRYLDVCTCCQC